MNQRLLSSLKEFFDADAFVLELIEYLRWVGAGGFVVGLFRLDTFDNLTLAASIVAIGTFMVGVFLRSLLKHKEYQKMKKENSK